MHNTPREDAQATNAEHYMGADEISELRTRLEKTQSTVSGLVGRVELVTEQLERLQDSMVDTTKAMKSTLERLDNVMRGDGVGTIGLLVRIDRVESKFDALEEKDSRRHAFWSKLSVGSVLAILGLIVDRLLSAIGPNKP